MSFGRPGGLRDTFKVTPPQRGSFPLDHDGECRDFMMVHLKCIKANGGDMGKCRAESRKYLECRMDHNLMARDDMANLGLGDVGTDHPVKFVPPSTTDTTTPTNTASAATPGSSSTGGSKPFNPSERI